MAKSGQLHFTAPAIEGLRGARRADFMSFHLTEVTFTDIEFVEGAGYAIVTAVSVDPKRTSPIDMVIPLTSIAAIEFTPAGGS